jgi:hypothetical protein
MSKSSQATKVPAQKTERPKTLTRADREAARIAEEKRAAHNARSRAWYAKKRAAAAALKAAPAPAPAAAPAAAPATPVRAPEGSLTKVELVGALKAALLILDDEQQRFGIRYALELAQKLEG